MDKLTHYKCKDNDCGRSFYIPKKVLGSKKAPEAHYCPYCGSDGLFNVTFEKDLGMFDQIG